MIGDGSRGQTLELLLTKARMARLVDGWPTAVAVSVTTRSRARSSLDGYEELTRRGLFRWHAPGKIPNLSAIGTDRRRARHEESRIVPSLPGVPIDESLINTVR